MSVSAIASLRPMHGQCLRHATTGLLSIRVTTRAASFHVRAVVALQSSQRRYQSSSNPRKPDEPSQDLSKPKGPKVTLRQVLGRALGAGLRTFASLNPRGVRSEYSVAPVWTSTIVVVFIVLIATSGIALWNYYTTFHTGQVNRYPEPVATSLRRALYFSKYRPDPERALKFWKKAMAQCTELGLDPFSEEVLGIRIQVAAWLESIDNFHQATTVLESVLQDCKKWVDIMEQSVRDGKVDDKGFQLPDTTPAKVGVKPAIQAGTAIKPVITPAAPIEKKEEDEEAETLWHKRQRVLSKAVATSVKLGELYADEHVLDPDKSHLHLVWAVETALTEFGRRRADGKKPGETTWLTPEEFGGSLESLGRNYERKSEFHLAIPLFFQALRLCESPCHRAVIMNNLSASFAQHPIYSPTGLTKPSDTMKELLDPGMPTTRQETLEAALNWAQNAYTHAQDVKGDDRTAECDEACAVALCNWGDVAAMLGKTELARSKYKQCVEMSHKLEFAAGVKQAQEGLAKLTSTPSKRV